MTCAAGAGAYYVYVTVPSLRIGFRDFVHLSLSVTAGGKQGVSPAGDAPGGKGPKEAK